MALIQSIIKKFREKQNEPVEEIDDDETRDKYLRSLRREWRIINEEKEKKYLKEKITQHHKKRQQELMFGKSILQGKKTKRKKAKQLSFLGKHKL